MVFVGVMLAVETCVDALKNMSRAVTTPEEIAQVINCSFLAILFSTIVGDFATLWYSISQWLVRCEYADWKQIKN